MWRKHVKPLGQMVYTMQRYCSVCGKYEKKRINNLGDLMKKRKKGNMFPEITERNDDFI